ncbi:putative udp-rhamnose:rhamnosyltransferase 1 [Quercus suber]|uniref:Udp-rhamnose:rhamnosyltransferase 1 n=1 Tax=Quercus suber TaxID=58331 RepID=A0AAW0KR17_QUESU
MARDHLHVVMLPWSAFGHLIPFFQLSIALAKSGIHVSFVSTPRNIQRLPKLPPSLATFIKFVEFPLPTLDNNDILPEGAEASVDVPADKLEYLKLAYDRLQYPINQFVAEQLPDWIIADFSAHWAVEIAQNYNVGFIYFVVFSAATVVFFGKPPNYFFVGDQKQAWPSPESLTSPPEWLSFPSSVAFRGYEAVWAHAGAYTEDASGISDAARFTKVVRACKALAIRSCREFEGEFLSLQEKLMGKPKEILAHPSIGGSLFHSGWGSAIEMLQFGHCLVVLPFIFDQPLNARLLVDKGVAVEVERGEDGSFSRDGIAKAVKLAMVLEEGDNLRTSAREAAAIFGDENLHQVNYIGHFVEYLKHGGSNKI